MSIASALLDLLHVLMPAVFGTQINLADIAAQAESNSAFRASSADVENWRVEAAIHLKLPSKGTLLLLLGAKSETVPRCVKLNNYWCIKGKGWTRQLGSDGNGHSAFEAAPAGARAAAILLRHYYVDLHRRSAMDITAHWAPNRCEPGLPTGPRTAATTRPPALEVAKMTQQQRMAAFDRIIAARRKVATEQSRQRLRFIKAANSGSAGRMPSMAPVSSRPATPAVGRTVAAMTPMFCELEERRITSYARQALRGIAQTPTEDLQLFTADGRSTWRAARMMVNMAAVEIGPKTVDEHVVAVALEQLDAATGSGS